MHVVEITVDEHPVRTGASTIVIIRCGDHVVVEEMRRHLAALDPAPELVALLRPGTRRGLVDQLSRHGAPVATAAPVTDALKRVAADRVVGSVDRTMLVRAGLPMLLRTGDLLARLAALGAATVPVGALVDGNNVVTLLDAADGGP